MDYKWLSVLLAIIVLSSVAYSALLYFSPIVETPLPPPESFLSFNQQIEKFVAEGVPKENQTQVLSWIRGY